MVLVVHYEVIIRNSGNVQQLPNLTSLDVVE